MMYKPRRLTLAAGMTAGALAMTLGGGAMAAVLDGTPGDDRITGTAQPDQIDALAGDDVVFGRGHDDELRGGRGTDSLFGEAGSDRLIGGPGVDLVRGGSGSDTIDAGGTDRIFGDHQDDTLGVYAGRVVAHGGSGDDDLYSRGPGASSLYGDDGADSFWVDPGNREGLLIDGGSGNDEVFDTSDTGAHTIIGGAGDDSLTAIGAAPVEYRAGAGDDLISAAFEDANPNVVFCGEGLDTAFLDELDRLGDDSCEDVTRYSAYTDAAEVIRGTPYHDVIEAKGGDDDVRSFGGDDWIELGSGEDTVSSGAGDDLIWADQSGDPATRDVVSCGDGWDEVDVDHLDVVAADCEARIEE